MAGMNEDRTRPARCPICAKPTSADYAPFCGARCKDRDLLQWLDEGYRLPGPPANDPDADAG